MYFEWYDSEVVGILRSTLKPGDIFVDVGSNIGYMSAIGAGLVGKTGQVHSFEPAPPYFQRLQRFAKMNPDYTIKVNQCAAGEEEGIARLVLNKENIGANAICLGTTTRESVEISVRRLDGYIEENIAKAVALIKIDVETYEFPVLRGLSRYFERTGLRPVIVCEIFPAEHPRATLTALAAFMKSYGYKTYDASNLQTEIDITAGWRGPDAVFKA